MKSSWHLLSVKYAMKLSAWDMSSSRLASLLCLITVVGLYFPSLTTKTCLARLLPIPVASLKALKPFKATEKGEIDHVH